MIFRFTLTAFILFLSFACHRNMTGSELSENSAVLVNAMEADSFIGTKSIGRTMDISPEYTRRHALMAEATTEELVALVGHENPVVGLSAFEGLVARDYLEVKPLLDYFAASKFQVHYIRGDVSSHISTLEYAYVLILEMPVEPKVLSIVEYANHGLSVQEQEDYLSQINALQEQGSAY